MDVQALKGKKVLITGAARGLGAAFATVLADAGAHIIMTGRLTEMLEGTAEAIRLRCGTKPDTHLLLSVDWNFHRRDRFFRLYIEPTCYVASGRIVGSLVVGPENSFP